MPCSSKSVRLYASNPICFKPNGLWIWFVDGNLFNAVILNGILQQPSANAFSSFRWRNKQHLQTVAFHPMKAIGSFRSFSATSKCSTLPKACGTYYSLILFISASERKSCVAHTAFSIAACLCFSCVSFHLPLRIPSQTVRFAKREQPQQNEPLRLFPWLWRPAPGGVFPIC